jgi:hypothetical protein
MKSITKYSPLAVVLMILIGVTFSLAQSEYPQPKSPETQSPQTPSSQSPSSQTQSAQAQSSTPGVQVNPAQVQKKANTPPPAGATKTSSVGQNVQMATPANSDSWAEQIDVDGNGTADQANLVWDGTDKVLFSDSSGTFTCRNGATGSGELLIAVNGTGNKFGRPAGSGFWVASMDKAQCGVAANSMWGCKFDATGAETTCGVATLDKKNNDLIIATVR